MRKHKRGRGKNKSSRHDYGGPPKPPPYFRQYVERLDYPARKSSLHLQAKESDIPADVVRILGRLPDHEYGSAEEVCRIADEVHGASGRSH